VLHSFINRNQKQDYFKQSTTRLFFIADKRLGKQTKSLVVAMLARHAKKQNQCFSLPLASRQGQDIFHWYVDPVSKDIM